VRLALKLVLSVLLVRPLAHVGLALAESLSLCAKTALMLAMFPDKLRGPEYRRVFRSFALTAVAGAGMAVVLTGVRPALDARLFAAEGAAASIAGMAAMSVVGGAAYAALAAAFQPVEVRDLYRLLRAGMERRRA
jgi:putative peptidoglycan lipid II flippase